MIVSISQSNYIPWKGYFDLIAKSDVFVIYDEVQYTKNDWRNRNIIKTAKGTEWLTIPVNQKGLNQRIYDTKVSFNNWGKKHRGTLQANYAKADSFKEVRDMVFDWLSTDAELLTDINTTIIKGICKQLGIGTRIIDSRELNLVGEPSERLVDACKKLDASVYLSGPAGRNYLKCELFEQEEMTVEWMDYSGYKEYSQLHPPFEHGVSVLDLLFNVGSDARNHIKY
ncbi:MAG: hypothetical protein ACJAYA_000397 [Bacteroidia bacterium]|jgi:hypothetical protein